MAIRMTFPTRRYPTADPRTLPYGTTLPDGVLLGVDGDYLLIASDEDEYDADIGTWHHTDGTPVEYIPAD